tara:strand:+ start:147 stop:356 length:210 start_codon:yes stop_codon:yes gene_type:complete
MLKFLIQPKKTNHPGGISMPIGFVDSEEKEDESWISDLIQHIISCLDEGCSRCGYAVESDFLGWIKTRE